MQIKEALLKPQCAFATDIATGARSAQDRRPGAAPYPCPCSPIPSLPPAPSGSARPALAVVHLDGIKMFFRVRPPHRWKAYCGNLLFFFFFAGVAIDFRWNNIFKRIQWG